VRRGKKNAMSMEGMDGERNESRDNDRGGNVPGNEIDDGIVVSVCNQVGPSCGGRHEEMCCIQYPEEGNHELVPREIVGVGTKV